jgi:hypothetical protein
MESSSSNRLALLNEHLNPQDTAKGKKKPDPVFDGNSKYILKLNSLAVDEWRQFA